MTSSTQERPVRPAGRPEDISGSEFRRVMGHLPTGVAVVASLVDSVPVGMAINSITSVSLDPPLIAVCIDNKSTTWPHLRSAGAFSVSILPEHQEHAPRKFSGPSSDRFLGVGWEAHTTGAVLDEAVAWIDCTVFEEHSAGDHTIVVAQVLDMGTADDGNALLFFRGQYGRFLPMNDATKTGTTR
jgi:flavin reductase (DIM6/NTAB) family NADH-FMN oxidoreductase RutF